MWGRNKSRAFKMMFINHPKCLPYLRERDAGLAYYECWKQIVRESAPSYTHSFCHARRANGGGGGCNIAIYTFNTPDIYRGCAGGWRSTSTNLTSLYFTFKSRCIWGAGVCSFLLLFLPVFHSRNIDWLYL